MSFDTLAPVYALLERVAAGGGMQRCRTAFLEVIPPPRRVLMLGEGHGRFLRACRERFPAAEITCVDASAGMLRQARQELARGRLEEVGIRFVKADVFTWEPQSGAYDLIVTHFFLDCFRPDELALLMPRIARAAAPGASWLLADFQMAAHGWQRLRSRCILALMHVFFRLATGLSARSLTPPEPFLKKAGFCEHRRVEMNWGLMKSLWWRRQEPVADAAGPAAAADPPR